MKKIILVFVFILSVLGISLLNTPTKAKAGSSCVDNCTPTCGHCSWDDGGTIYICPSGYKKKIHTQ